MEKVVAIIERNSDGRYDVYTEHEFPDFMVAGFGNTAEEAKEDFNEVFLEMKADSEARGNVVEDVEFEFKYDVASTLDYLNKILTKTAIARVTGLNPIQLTHYSSGLKKPRPATVAKIQTGLNHLVDTIKQVQVI